MAAATGPASISARARRLVGPARRRLGPRRRPSRAGDRARDGLLDSDAYPDGLARLWSALRAPRTPATSWSRSREGYECVDWGGATHVGGASHGALRAGDSLGPLVLCGLEPGVDEVRDQWALRDVAGLVLEHFGVGGRDSEPGAEVPAPRLGGERAHEPESSTEHPAVEAADAARDEPRGARTSAPATPPPAEPTGPGSSRVGSTSAPASPRTGRSCSSSASSAAPATSSTWPSSPLLTQGLGLHHILSAVGAFCVAVTNNFLWNRHWTFRATEGHRRLPGGSLLHRQRPGAGRQPDPALPARRRRRRPGAAIAGPRRGRGDAVQLHRQQAVDLRERADAEGPERRAPRWAAPRSPPHCSYSPRLQRRRRPRLPARPARRSRRPPPRRRPGHQPRRTTNLSRADAIRIARDRSKVAEQRARHGPLRAEAEPKPGTWQVDFYAGGTDRAQVIVDDATRPCASRGPATRSPGRWRGATRTSSVTS